MKQLAVLFGAVVFSIGANAAPDSRAEGEAALRALKGLEARCEAGISYPSYRAQVSDTYVQVRAFTGKPEDLIADGGSSGDKYFHAKVAAVTAIMHYQNIGSLWGVVIEQPELWASIHRGDVIGGAAKKLCDHAAKDMDFTLKGRSEWLSDCVSEAWEEASLLVKKTGEELRKVQTKGRK